MKNNVYLVYLFIALILLLMIAGLLAIYSVSGGVISLNLKKQLIAIIISLAFGFFIMKIEQQLIYNNIINFYMIFFFYCC